MTQEAQKTQAVQKKAGRHQAGRGPNSQRMSKRELFATMAENPNARVVVCNTLNTFILTDLAQQADVGIARLRKNMMFTIDPQVVVDQLDKFNKCVIALEKVVAEINKTAGNQRYQAPRGIKQLLQDDAVTEQDSDDAKKVTLLPAGGKKSANTGKGGEKKEAVTAAAK